MLLNCGLEKILESSLDIREIQLVHPKGNQSWIFIGRTDVEAETPILWTSDAKSWPIWKRPWCWEGLKVGGEVDNREWDGWMASPTQWTWVWVNPKILMDREAWSAAVHGVTKRRTRLSNWTELNIVGLRFHVPSFQGFWGLFVLLSDFHYQFSKPFH